MSDDTLMRLAETIRSRKGADPATSWTAKLLARGPKKAAQKFGEEAVEAVIEAARGDQDKLTDEAADVLYHFLVMLTARDVRLEDVYAVPRGPRRPFRYRGKGQPLSAVFCTKKRAGKHVFSARRSQLGRNDPSGETAHAQLAKKPLILNLWAAVLDHGQTCCLRLGRGLSMADANLHPDHLGQGVHRQGGFHNLGHGLGPAKYVDDINRTLNRGQIRDHLSPKQPRARMDRVHGHHGVAFEG